MAKLLEATPVVYVKCGKCFLCGKETWIVTRLDWWNKYSEDSGRTHIQNLLPEMPVGTRESLISGTHEACFDKAFDPEDDGDETEELVSFCPVCGDVIDFCPGHGELG